MTAAIVVDSLVKHYGDTAAVDGVSFSVDRGEVYGLLGANGAGKSTTVEILEGHRQRTSGSVSVLGFDPAQRERDFRDRIGIVLQTSGVERVLTVREVLQLYGQCYRQHRPVDECLALVGLEDSAGKRCDRLSGGQRRRLDLALGIIGRPEVLFLDEPTVGFDPAARRGAWELIRSLCSGGTTVLLTSHYLDEVEHLADRVGVLSRGRLVSEGAPAALAERNGDTIVRFRVRSGSDAVEVAGLIDGHGRVEHTAGDVVVTTTAPTLVLHELTGWALEHGHDLAGLTVHRPSLEDLFLALAGEDSSGDDD